MTQKQLRLLIIIVICIWLGVAFFTLQTVQVRQQDTYVQDPNQPTPACMGLDCSDPSLMPQSTEEPFVPDFVGPNP